MRIGLGRAERLTQRRCNLAIAQPLNVPKHDRCSVAPGQGCQLPREFSAPLGLEQARLRLLAGIAGQRARPVARRPVQRRGRQPALTPLVARDVQRDLIEPWPHSQRGDPLGRVAGEGAIGAHKGILGNLLGILRVAGQTQREGEEPVLVGQHQPLEISGQVAGQRGQQVIGCHDHHSSPAASFLLCDETRATACGLQPVRWRPRWLPEWPALRVQCALGG